MTSKTIDFTEHLRWLHALASLDEREGQNALDLEGAEAQVNAKEYAEDLIGLIEGIGDKDEENAHSEADSGILEALLKNPQVLPMGLLSSLPAALRDQIPVSEGDRFEANVLGLVNAATDKSMMLDNIMIGLYVTTKELHPRSKLNGRLYRMVQKGLIYSVPKKKGVYTTVKPAEDEEL